MVWGSCSATPTESRSDSSTSLNLPPISLSDSLELLDWTGRQLRRVREATQTKRCVTRVMSDDCESDDCVITTSCGAAAEAEDD